MLFSDFSLVEHGHPNTAADERNTQHQPAPITSLAASVLPACHKGKANDRSLFATRTKVMSKKSDQGLVTIVSYREGWLQL